MTERSSTHFDQQLANGSPKPSHFDRLPDEIAMKIINLATGTSQPETHNFLVNVISNISPRFNRLAADRSLWKGRVSIGMDPAMVEEVIHKFLGKEVRELSINPYFGEGGITHETALSANDIAEMAARCPRLEFLRMRIGRWPALGASWLSLKVLILKGVGKDCFASVDLNKSIPNIEYLSLAGQDRVAIQ